MKAIRFQLKGELHSFREPSFHTYHKTLPFPPKTTLCGLFGAALGVSPSEVNDLFLVGSPPRVEVGVVVNNIGGFTNDLWKIKKVKSGKKEEGDKPPSEDAIKFSGNWYYGGVIVREMLFQPIYTVFVRSSDEELLTRLFSSLQNPSWALSLGREDELVRVVNLDWCEVREIGDDVFYESAVLPAEKYLLDIESLKSTQGKARQLHPPLVIRLPLFFQYKEDGEREGKEWLPFLFSASLKIQPKDSRSRGYTDGQYNFQFF